MRLKLDHYVFLTVLIVSIIAVLILVNSFTGFQTKKIDRDIKFVETIPPEIINYECPLSFELSEVNQLTGRVVGANRCTKNNECYWKFPGESCTTVGGEQGTCRSSAMIHCECVPTLSIRTPRTQSQKPVTNQRNTNVERPFGVCGDGICDFGEVEAPGYSDFKVNGKSITPCPADCGNDLRNAIVKCTPTDGGVLLDYSGSDHRTGVFLANKKPGQTRYVHSLFPSGKTCENWKCTKNFIVTFKNNPWRSSSETVNSVYCAPSPQPPSPQPPPSPVQNVPPDCDSNQFGTAPAGFKGCCASGCMIPQVGNKFTPGCSKQYTCAPGLTCEGMIFGRDGICRGTPLEIPVPDGKPCRRDSHCKQGSSCVNKNSQGIGVCKPKPGPIAVIPSKKCGDGRIDSKEFCDPPGKPITPHYSKLFGYFLQQWEIDNFCTIDTGQKLKQGYVWVCNNSCNSCEQKKVEYTCNNNDVCEFGGGVPYTFGESYTSCPNDCIARPPCDGASFLLGNELNSGMEGNRGVYRDGSYQGKKFRLESMSLFPINIVLSFNGVSRTFTKRGEILDFNGYKVRLDSLEYIPVESLMYTPKNKNLKYVSDAYFCFYQEQICGNGNLEGSEGCDYSNQNTIDNCPVQNKKCGKLLGKTGSDACQCFTYCGNGVVDVREDGVQEQCDGDKFAAGFNDGTYRCTYDCMAVKITSYCGDGKIDSGELCEVKNNEYIFSSYLDVNNDGVVDCKDYGFSSGRLKCNVGKCGDNQNAVILDECQGKVPVCGNGVVESGEECDDGSDNSDTEPDKCRTTCVRPFPGDGVCDTGEEAHDDCKNLCLQEFSNAQVLFYPDPTMTKTTNYHFNAVNQRTSITIVKTQGKDEFKNDNVNVVVGSNKFPGSSGAPFMITFPNVDLGGSSGTFQVKTKDDQICTPVIPFNVKSCKESFLQSNVQLNFLREGEVQVPPKGPDAQIELVNVPGQVRNNVHYGYTYNNLVVEVDGERTSFDENLKSNINFKNKPSNVKIIDKDTEQVCLEIKNLDWFDVNAPPCNNDNVCDVEESISTCSDCEPNTCGNHVCESSEGGYNEDFETCPEDCSPSCQQNEDCNVALGEFCCPMKGKCMMPPQPGFFVNENCEYQSGTTTQPVQPPTKPEKSVYVAPERTYKVREMGVPVKHCPDIYTIPGGKKFYLKFKNPTTYGERPKELERLHDQKLPVYVTCMGQENMDFISKGIGNVYSREFRLALPQLVECHVRVLDYRAVIRVDPLAETITKRRASIEEITEIISTDRSAYEEVTRIAGEESPEETTFPPSTVTPTMITTPTPEVTPPERPSEVEKPVKTEYLTKPTKEQPIIITSEPVRGKTLTIRIKSKSTKPEITVNILSDASKYPKIVKAKRIEPGIYEVKITPYKQKEDLEK